MPDAISLFTLIISLSTCISNMIKASHISQESQPSREYQAYQASQASQASLAHRGLWMIEPNKTSLLLSQDSQDSPNSISQLLNIFIHNSFTMNTKLIYCIPANGIITPQSLIIIMNIQLHVMIHRKQ